MSDPRFARLHTDPRFRRPKQKALKVELDDRFKDVLDSEEFGGKGKGKGKAMVDKHGRQVTASHHQDQLKRFYRVRSPEPSTSEQGFVDYARGEGDLYSSGSEEDDEEEPESDVEEEELALGAQTKRKLPHQLLDEDESDESDEDEDESEDDSHLDIDLSETEDVPGFAEDEEDQEEDDGPTSDPTTRVAAVNLDWDNLRAADLFAVFNSFLKAGSTPGSSAQGALGRLLDVKIYPSQFGKSRMEKEDQAGPGGGIFLSKGKAKSTSHREGLVRAEDLEAVEGNTEDDSGDDDEVDEQDGELEDIDSDDLEDDNRSTEHEDEDGGDDSEEGPAGEDLEIISDVSSERGEEEIDMDQLRQYQLERLRYYYAIATFSSVAAARKVLEECNGTEFERTANIFDLSYVPEGMEFEDGDVTDEANKETKGYKGNEFVTDALRHSKVKLTWDQDDPNRTKITRRNLTLDELIDQDLKAYIASGSEGEDDDEDDADQEPEQDRPFAKKAGSKAAPVANGIAKPSSKSTRKAAIKDRTAALRNLLLAGDDDLGDLWGKQGRSSAKELDGAEDKETDMEITFKPGLSLSGTKGTQAEDDTLTTLEKYQLRMREKKARKKEKVEIKRAEEKAKDKAERDAEKAGAQRTKAEAKDEDDFFGDSDDSISDGDEVVRDAMGRAASGRDQRADSSDEGRDLDAPAEDIHADLQGGQDSHFNMKDILKAEKGGKKRRRAKKGKNAAAREAEREEMLGPQGWKIDVKDDRFKALHEEPEFAIDPSNPQFKKTQAMKDMLAERNRRRAQGGDVQRKEPVSRSAVPNGAGAKEKDLGALVQSIKRKSQDGGRKKKRSRH